VPNHVRYYDSHCGSNFIIRHYEKFVDQAHLNFRSRNPTFGRVWGWDTHSWNGDLGVHWDSRNFRVRLQGSKTLHIGVFFISLESYRSVDVENGLAWAIWRSTSQIMAKRKARSQIDSWPLKVENRPNPDACRWSATHSWKALNKSYKFASDLTPIGGLNKEL
jgi:hypothetical protein